MRDTPSEQRAGVRPETSECAASVDLIPGRFAFRDLMPAATRQQQSSPPAIAEATSEPPGICARDFHETIRGCAAAIRASPGEPNAFASKSSAGHSQ